MSLETHTSDVVKALVAELSDSARAVLAKVLEIEQAKLHMSVPTNIVEDIKSVIVEAVK
jgi:hypothetical protein